MSREKPEVVVVTGASAGVGRAIAQSFAKRGARIGLLARGEEGLAGATADVEQAGGRALAVPTDVADFKQIEKAADAVEDAFGPIDVWVNNAMATVFGPLEKITPEEFRRVTEVSYLGTVYGTQVALARMKPRDHGSIVQVGSTLAYRGIPLQSAYCGAKHAVQGFTESVRCELIYDKSKIHISMVQLPAMNTPQFDWSLSKMPRKAQPVPPIYQPEVAAQAIVYIVDHPRREMDVGANTVIITLGNKFAPGFGDHYLASTGYDAQMSDQPEDPNRPHNLYEPVSGDFGTHGRFDSEATDSSLQLWMSTSWAWQGVHAVAEWFNDTFVAPSKDPGQQS